MTTSLKALTTLAPDRDTGGALRVADGHTRGDDGVTVRPKLLYLVAEDHYFWTHRRCIAEAAQAAGFEVTVVTRAATHAERIRQAGFRLVPFSLRRDSLNPLRELLTLYKLVRLYRRERPTLVHHVALKPMLYGTLAARLSGVSRIVNSVAGLGGLSNPRGLGARCMALCAKLAMRGVRAGPESVTIFQTEYDRDAFAKNGFVASSRVAVIRGAGVDLNQFAFRPEPDQAGPPIVMLAGRLLWNKGVRELVEAGKQLRARGVQIRIVFVGVPDHESLQAVPEHQLEAWVCEGLAEWWGYQEDMPETLGKASVVVLPTTYGEGVPKILLEAGAVGRPVVVSDVPGCQEVVSHGDNGLIVPAGDDERTANAIESLVKNPEDGVAMGLRGRARVEAEYSDRVVASATLAVYKEMASPPAISTAPRPIDHADKLDAAKPS